MNITYNLELNTKPGKDGRHTVLLRITANRKHKRIKTTVAVKPTKFDKKRIMANGYAPDTRNTKS